MEYENKGNRKRKTTCYGSAFYYGQVSSERVPLLKDKVITEKRLMVIINKGGTYKSEKKV